MPGRVAPHAACADSADTDRTEQLRAVLQALPTEELPQRLCCDRGGIIDPNNWSIDILDTQRQDAALSIRLGLFFTEIVGGCNCHDDPATYHEHRILRLTIACPTGELHWRLD